MGAKTHGKTRHPIYAVWNAIKQRCHDPNSSGFHKYGARGIAMCDAWRYSFEQFYADMGDPPPGHQIDRIDNLGNYTPENCRWATRGEQARNRRSTRWIQIGEETKCLIDWLNHFGISREAYYARRRLGWDVQRAIRTPIDPIKSRRLQRGIVPPASEHQPH